MSSYQTVQPTDAVVSSRNLSGVLPLFTLSLFMSALLLFSVQPMFAKMILPSLGGAPGVWNTSMVFFQTILLAGYAYAHFSVKLLGVRRQALVHLVVLALAFLFLPVGFSADAKPWPGQPELWLLWTLTQSVGLPFLAIAATAPLLQKWFSETGHRHAKDPYFLYGASNIGSLIALLGYPFLVEPMLALGAQSYAWMLGYGLLSALILICVFVARRGTTGPITQAVSSVLNSAAAPRPGWRDRLYWIVLALVPSSLLLGVTTHISTDVAAAPLLWVVPLALYLLTFVIVFARRPVLRQSWMLRAQQIVMIPLLASFVWYIDIPVAAAIHLTAFFVTTMVCHGELARRRPDVAYLTEFYLWMSFGGMVGGFFAALVAPVIFDAVIEYPLMIVIACLLRPSQQTDVNDSCAGWVKLSKDFGLPLILLATIVLGNSYLGTEPSDLKFIGPIVLFLLVALAIYGFAERPLRYAVGVAMVFAAIPAFNQASETLDQQRNFFGITRIAQTQDGEFNLLFHGTTLHGAQHTDPTKWRDPLTYYGRTSPIGQLFSSLVSAGRGSSSRVGVVGLGAGTLACYREPGQDWTFFEIDPAIESIARDGNYFHYLSSCAGDSPVVIGDARLSLQSELDNKYDVLVFDAFSSDAIPIHLLTREALALYESKLAPGGVIALHISNRTLKLEPIVGRLAEDAGLSGLSLSTTQLEQGSYNFKSVWIVLARDAVDLAFLNEQSDAPGLDDESAKHWQDIASQPKGRLWTDDFSDILSAIDW